MFQSIWLERESTAFLILFSLYNSAFKLYCCEVFQHLKANPNFHHFSPMYSVWKQENYLTKIHLRCEFDLEYVILHEAIMQLEGHERMPRSPLEQLWGITEPPLL